MNLYKIQRVTKKMLIQKKIIHEILKNKYNEKYDLYKKKKKT